MILNSHDKSAQEAARSYAPLLVAAWFLDHVGNPGVTSSDCLHCGQEFLPGSVLQHKFRAVSGN